MAKSINSIADALAIVLSQNWINDWSSIGRNMVNWKLVVFSNMPTVYWKTGEWQGMIACISGLLGWKTIKPGRTRAQYRHSVVHQYKKYKAKMRRLEYGGDVGQIEMALLGINEKTSFDKWCTCWEDK